MSALVEHGAQALALIALAGAIAAATGVALARSLFAGAMYLGVAAALVAAALAALGFGAAALIVALLASLAVAVFLAVLLLSTRTAKSRRAPRPWFTLAGAAAALTALVLTVSLAGAPAAQIIARAPQLGLWLTALAFAAAATAVGLIGFGERGAFEPHERDR